MNLIKIHQIVSDLGDSTIETVQDIRATIYNIYDIGLPVYDIYILDWFLWSQEMHRIIFFNEAD